MAAVQQEERETAFGHVLIVGMGLIGGSIALALKALENPPHLYGVAASQRTVQRAVDEGFVEQCFQSDDPALDQLLASGTLDLVVLASPVPTLEPMLNRIENSGYTGCITDAASTKNEICAIAQATLSDNSRFIPGHPMAGSEVSGLSGAKRGLFRGKYWILCPDDRSNPDMFLQLHALVTSMGARCISVDRRDHDDMVAVVSHVPHMTASALVELAKRHAADSDEIFRLAATGFKDSTRIAAGSPSLWTGIAMSNRRAITSGIHELREILGTIEELLRSCDEQGLEDFLAGTSEVRQDLPADWVAKSEQLTLVSVAMTNRVGTLATVTSIAGRMGCNIQSIGIEHVTDKSAMLRMVLTDEGDVAGMLDALMEEGFYVEQQPAEVTS